MPDPLMDSDAAEAVRSLEDDDVGLREVDTLLDRVDDASREVESE